MRRVEFYHRFLYVEHAHFLDLICVQLPSATSGTTRQDYSIVENKPFPRLA